MTDPGLTCDVAAVTVTMSETPRLQTALESVRASATHRDVAVICVINDPSARGAWERNGIRYVGAGMNLGWAAGVHAGLNNVASEYVWAIQDDLVMDPHALRHLVAVLDDDPELAAVRPLNVDRNGVVHTGHQGCFIDDQGEGHDYIPAAATLASVYRDPRSGTYLPSSGQLIRRTVWDAVGGFDPWFYPWGFIDIDFGRTLTASGWRFRSVPDARMTHSTAASTTAMFRAFATERNRSLFRRKWATGPVSEGGDVAPISPAIIEAAQAGRGQPRDTDLDCLQAIAGIAASDLVPSLVAWMRHEGAYHGLRAMRADQSIRRAALARARSDVRAGIARRLGR